MSSSYREKCPRHNTHPVWTPDNWDKGFLKDGRFHVYRPDCPRHCTQGSKITESGFVKRYHAVWWLNTGDAIKPGFHIHHKNGDCLDDRFENLELLSASEHAAMHNPPPKMVEISCSNCGKAFSVTQSLYNRRHCKYCSRECSHGNVGRQRKDRPVSKCANCGKEFIGAKTYVYTFCSLSCKASTQNKERKILFGKHVG